MKTIGIKLADGSFYPVLEEGTPSEKQLDLTTAHNNQTKIVVDLYRSSNCSMDDAEYVDSLLIENMNEHPNGEPAITFQVSLDEENELSAKIIDPETGNQSNTTITLVSRTIEERLVTDEYNISDTIVTDALDEEKTPAKKATGAGLLAIANALNAKEDSSKDVTEEISEDDFTLGDPDASLDVNDDVTIEGSFEETPMDFDLPDITEEAPVETEETAVTEEEVTGSFEDIEQGNLEEDKFNLSESEFEFAEDAKEESAPEINLDFDLDSPEPAAEETVEASLDDFSFDENELPDFNFDANSTETTQEEIAPEDDYSLPDFDDIPDQIDTTESFDSLDLDGLDMDQDLFADMPSDDPVPAGNGISFTGLYDTNDLDDSSELDEDDIHKKTKVPVIICIICAIICVIATLLILFIIPSKYNLITKKNSKEPAPTEIVIENPVAEPEPIPEPEPEPIPEPEPEPVPEAVEDEVIVIEKAEEVVPLPPPVVEEVKPKNITYKIRWGDTLWDIANTYYKNPWKYKYIARYNGIKDPDYIISGTYIIIPAE